MTLLLCYQELAALRPPGKPGSCGEPLGGHTVLAPWHDWAKRSHTQGWWIRPFFLRSVSCMWIQPVSWELALQVVQGNRAEYKYPAQGLALSPPYLTAFRMGQLTQQDRQF